MIRPNVLLATALAGLISLSSAASVSAQNGAVPAGITPREIDAHLQFLSSDLLEGRAPATRGGQLAEEYIASQLKVFGVDPGVGDSSYFQRVPIDVVKADPKTVRVTASGKANANLRFTDDVVVWPGSATDASSARGELVFVGYGAAAPEYKWDDFKGTDVRGKFLLVLVNDPPAPASEPNLFGGKAMTYYGRWTYKFEEAERRGAAGMLIVHTTEAASYPWQVVVNSWSTEQRLLARDPSLPAPLGVRGWITDSAATALLAQAGLNMSQLRKQAESRSFRPVPTGIIIDASMRNTLQHLSANNVVGVVRGIDPKLRDEYVAYSAHWDHFGIGPKINGDSIYNGAVDNASGVASVLTIAHAAAEGVKPRRSQLFVFVTAEEAGLLGSAYFAQHPTVPAAKIVADLNMDVVTLAGRVKDLNVMGDNKSSIGPLLARLVAPQGVTIAPDAHPEAGHFYRSDHFSFAKAGIPAVSIGGGVDYVDRPAGWGLKEEEDYTAHHYHQPSDEYRSDFDLRGAAELAEIVYKLGVTIGNADAVPTWNADAEFKALRDASRKGS
ncbi:MAG TPA: M28 family peptidase [Gemmatimonadaceae bacterium]|jgi:Zn-dependent M28 family amino/carboxypeptidase|nr:M28 family peptidase [Gemmatimonadaceae bacterium]